MIDYINMSVVSSWNPLFTQHVYRYKLKRELVIYAKIKMTFSAEQILMKRSINTYKMILKEKENKKVKESQTA